MKCSVSTSRHKLRKKINLPIYFGFEYAEQQLLLLTLSTSMGKRMQTSIVHVIWFVTKHISHLVPKGQNRGKKIKKDEVQEKDKRQISCKRQNGSDGK